jgi:hypothetical protein
MALAGLVRRHHLPAHALRLPVSGCHDALAYPECVRWAFAAPLGPGSHLTLTDIQHAGSRLLRRSAERGYQQA